MLAFSCLEMDRRAPFHGARDDGYPFGRMYFNGVQTLGHKRKTDILWLTDYESFVGVEKLANENL